MRNLGLLAFIATTCVLVPAAIHQLRAGHDEIVKFVAAEAGELALGGATIEARLEHPLVDPGEGLRIKLRASGANGKRLEVGVLVYGSSGTEGSRVPSPPVGVAHQTVTLAIDADGNGSKELTVPLRGAVNDRYDPMPFSHYTVLVMAPEAADKLDLLRRRSQLIGGDEGIPSYNRSAEHFMQLYSWGSELAGNDARLFAAGSIARLSAHTRSINPAITLETPASAPMGTAFTVAVVVNNPGNQVASDLELTLDTPTGVLEQAEESTGVGGLVMPDRTRFDLAPGQTRRFEFRVMSGEVGILGLYARVTCHASECAAPDALTSAGTFDATEIAKPDAVDGRAIVGAE